ncbi:hypothetical protein [Pseudoduganella lutea]|uniref:Uncharacterized protein n=1 Tax=Pseudoduganella lutea TaxID=321985 RepID=A0A4P6KSK7_9BURK|nr:hypothetical protein [Pseudoduganella lutea]QBE61667.1 hypothetical protein EWM63_00490 [Pseudoduganella lutea]
MDWFPIVAGTFKALALATGMFFAIKWHYDQGEKEQDKRKQRRAVLRAAGKVTVVFMLSLFGLGLFTLALVRQFDVNLALP